MYLRLALRRLNRTPAFTAGAVVLLALGTGATLVVFTILNALVLKTLPVRDPERLVAIEVQNFRGEPAALPRTLFDTLSLRQQSLDHVTGVLGGSVVSAEVAGSAHQATVDGVTTDYFSLLAVPIVAGRPIGSADYRAGTSDANTVAVLSDGYATRIFGSPMNALGRPIVLGETIVTVVGVSADAFAGIQVGVHTDVVVPAPVVGRIIGLQPNSVPLRYVFGRLTDGRSIADVRAEWSAIWQSELASSASGKPPFTATERRLVVSSGATGVSGWRSRYREPLQFTMMATAWLIVIACVNLAGLQFARALRRTQEVAVSRALGASDWDVIAPAVMESLLICLAGLLLGAPLAWWGVHLVVDLLSTGSAPLALDLTPDWSTWAVLAMITAAVTMATGLVPAWFADRRVGGLAAPSRVVPGHRRIGSVLVAGQIALAVVLLSGAAVAVDGLLRVVWREYGFESDRILAAQLMNRPGGYTDLDDEVYYRTLLDRVRSLPGVSAAALAKPVPATLSASPIQEPVRPSDSMHEIGTGVVMGSPGYFEVLRLRVLSGRLFDWRDTPAAPAVAVVSRALARDLMPEGFRPGLRIDVGRLPHHQGIEVIGVVDDASVLNVRDAAPRIVYLSTVQQPRPFARWPGLIVRTGSSAQDLTAIVTRSVDALGHEFVIRADTLSAYITRSLAQERLLAAMAIVYGSLALAMVAIGLWALLAQDVTRRLREFGVRLSLGASPAMLARAITARAIRLTAAGTTLGTVGAWMLSRAMTAAISGHDPTSPWIVPGAVGLLVLIALFAAVGPARRAARTAPMAALRTE